MSKPELKEGMMAPNFTLPTEKGEKVSLSDFRGKKVVLYFYPKDDTPGCTTEACSFRDNIGSLQGRNTVILGVSRDDVESHKKFIQKYSLPFTLLSDLETEVCQLYDVYKMKTFMGISKMGIERSTFVIDEQGKIRKIFRGVKVDGHTKEVLEVLS